MEKPLNKLLLLVEKKNPDLNHTEIAEKLSISKVMYHHYRKLEYRLKVEEIIRISNIFEISDSEIVSALKATYAV